MTSHLKYSGALLKLGRSACAKCGATRWSLSPLSMMRTISFASHGAERVGVRNWLSVSFMASPICVETLVGQMTEVRTRGAL